jgi:hypothetical protein
MVFGIMHPERDSELLVINDHKWLSFTGGSNTRNLAGTHSVRPKKGDIITYESGACDGTTWFRINGERVKHEGNGWCPLLKKNLIPIVTGEDAKVIEHRILYEEDEEQRKKYAKTYRMVGIYEENDNNDQEEGEWFAFSNLYGEYVMVEFKTRSECIKWCILHSHMKVMENDS